MTAGNMWLYIVALVCIVLLVDSFRTAYRKGLRSLPGPKFACLTGFYRFGLVYRGDAPEQYREVHKRYGKIVRVGPNHVSVSDPAMIPVIYGIGSKFVKVISRTFECYAIQADLLRRTSTK